MKRTGYVHLQVDYGNDETALVEPWRVRPSEASKLLCEVL